VALWNGPEYDCQVCGACCVQQRPLDGSSYVWLDRQEARRMRRLGLTVVQAAPGETFLGCRAHPGAGGRPTCVAFDGVVGGACGCSVYADRPDVCRRFEVGERLCREARRQASLPL
jgi:Fe-S-cluster containining protein